MSRAVILLSGLLAANCFAAEQSFLFVDDHHVLYRSGTKRVFHPATSHPANPLIREDKAWEMAIGWTSVYRDPASGKYQLWHHRANT